MMRIMMTASELARKASVPVYTVRHYTRIGLLKPSRDLSNGYKMYRPSDRDRLTFITSAKNLGFTLGEIDEILGHAEHDESPCPMVREIVEKRVEENRAKIAELEQMQKRLETALSMWKGMRNSQPDGHSVCRLIESFATQKESA